MSVHSNSSKSVLIDLKLLTAKSMNLKVLSVLLFDKMYKNYLIRPYVVLQIFLVERPCTAVHYQHK